MRVTRGGRGTGTSVIKGGNLNPENKAARIAPGGLSVKVSGHRLHFVPECRLKTGSGTKNVLMIGLRRTVNGATLRAAEIAPYPDSAEVMGE
jgi:hypothetical protein